MLLQIPAGFDFTSIVSCFCIPIKFLSYFKSNYLLQGGLLVLLRVVALQLTRPRNLPISL